MRSQSEKSKDNASSLEVQNKLGQLSDEELLDQLACSPCAERQLDANTPLEEYLQQIDKGDPSVTKRVRTDPA